MFKTEFIEPTEQHYNGLRKYLARRGYEIVGEFEPGAPVAFVGVCPDSGELAFVSLFVVRGNMGSDDIGPAARARVEECAYQWLENNFDRADCVIRFDILVMRLIGESNALLRHHINAFGGSPC